MSALTRYEPLDEWFMEPFRDSWRDMVRRFRRPDLQALRTPSELRVDVTESDTAYTVTAEIPRAKKEDIVVTIDGNLVSIGADIKDDREPKGNGERVLTRELRRGAVSRAFTLAHEIDDQQAAASVADGLLTLTLPKRAAARGTTVVVR